MASYADETSIIINVYGCLVNRSADTVDESVLEGPPSAGLIVVMAARGGMFRETPKADHTKYRTPQELRDNGLRHLRTAVAHTAVALLETKATAEEVDGYRRFVLTLVNNVAAAHRENGQSVSPAEAEAIDQIAATLGGPGSAR